MIDTPPLAAPVKVAAKGSPAVIAAENTSNKRCPAVTGIDKPLVMPLLLKPRPIKPDRVGDRVDSSARDCTEYVAILRCRI